MPVFQEPDFVSLYDAYTGAGGGIGGDLARVTTHAAASDPLIAATAAEIVFYPGLGRAPEILAFRHATRGFRELAAVSHLGPAVVSLVVMRRDDPDRGAWRRRAEDLRRRLARVQAANGLKLWRDAIAVEAYRGREQSIVDMCNYGCALTDRLLEVVLDDESKLDADYVRLEYLEACGRELGATVPMNQLMIATFFLVGLDISFRLFRWLDAYVSDWSRVMVLITGQQGRPTSGVTLATNSIAQIIRACSDDVLPLDRLYIAPHFHALKSPGQIDLDAVREAEGPLRRLWGYTRAISALGPLMFPQAPRYAPDAMEPPALTPTTLQLAEMPRVDGPHDWDALTARLRLVMEDPRQLLSGCVTDLAARALRAVGADPSQVTVPGLDGVSYLLAPVHDGARRFD